MFSEVFQPKYDKIYSGFWTSIFINQKLSIQSCHPELVEGSTPPHHPGLDPGPHEWELKIISLKKIQKSICYSLESVPSFKINFQIPPTFKFPPSKTYCLKTLLSLSKYQFQFQKMLHSVTASCCMTTQETHKL